MKWGPPNMNDMMQNFNPDPNNTNIEDGYYLHKSVRENKNME